MILAFKFSQYIIAELAVHNFVHPQADWPHIQGESHLKFRNKNETFLRDNSFSTCAKFSQKHSLPPPDRYMCMYVLGGGGGGRKKSFLVKFCIRNKWLISCL